MQDKRTRIVNILARRKRGETYRAIGKHLNLSGERVRQLIPKYAFLLDELNQEISDLDEKRAHLIKLKEYVQKLMDLDMQD